MSGIDLQSMLVGERRRLGVAVAAGALAGIGFVWSTTGFGIGAVVAVLREVR